jgi:hypothetical protein
MGRSLRALLTLLVVGAGVGFAAACGTDAVGVESCRKIEGVRCERAPRCNIPLDRPTHRGDTEVNDVAACIRFYDDACLHGLAVAEDPGAQIVDACAAAIIEGSCDVVRTPEIHPACAWLKPPDPPPPPPPAADAATE